MLYKSTHALTQASNIAMLTFYWKSTNCIHFRERFDIWFEIWSESFGIWKKWNLRFAFLQDSIWNLHICAILPAMSCRETAYTVFVYRQHSHNVRSATTTLCQPSTTTTFAKRAYRCSAPAVWNSRPKTVVNSDSVAVFKSRLKTFLFSRAFSLPSPQQHTAWPQRLWTYDIMALYI